MTKILIVEDDPAILLASRRVLEKAGYETLGAASAADALRLTREHQPELVLLDVNLPDKSGLEVCRQIKATPELQDTFVIIASGTYTDSESQAAGLDLGADGYITRPIPNRELLARVEAMLRIRTAKVSLRRAQAETQSALEQSERSRRALLSLLEDQKRAEEALASEHTLLRTIIDLLPSTVYAKDVAGRKRLANRADLELLGVSTEAEALGKTDFDFYPEEVAARLCADDQAVIQTGQPLLNCEESIVTADGQTRWLLTSKAPLKDSTGQVIGLVGVGHDITERRRAEEALRQSEQKFRSFVEYSADAIVLTDEQGLIIEWNPAAERVFGLARADALGQPLWDVQFQVAPEERRTPQAYEWLKATILDALRTGQSPMLNQLREVRVRWPGGESRAIQTVAFPIRTAAGFLLGSISRDVTEQRQAQEMLQQYTERLRTLRAIDGAILAAWSQEEIARAALGHVRQLLPCRRAGVARFDLQSNVCILLVSYADGEFRVEPEARHPLDPGFVEYLRQGRSLIVDDLLSSPSPIPAVCGVCSEGMRAFIAAPLIAQGELLGVLSLGTDSPAAFTPEHADIAREVVDQLALGLYQAHLREEIERQVAMLEQRVAERTAELSLANAELARAARLKDEFLAAMSHELRTPLNAILGLSEALQEEVYGPLTDRQIQSLHTIEESGRHLLTLINDILDVSKIEAGKVELTPGPVSVESVCQASLGLIKQEAHKKQLTVSTDFDPSVATIQADVRRLKQILVNLLSNAVKFTPAGGAIGLQVTGDAEQGVVRFSVWDTGIGIAPEQMDRLFQPFVQLDSSLARQHTGTGLGLVLVHRLTDMHGGSVAVESEPGKGSRFTVSFPWRQGYNGKEREEQEEPFTPLPPPPLPTSPSRSLSILLVEDNEANLQMTADYLTGMGYRVLVARGGAEAVEQAVEQRPDLILMDIQMPGVDGLEATRRIRAHAELADTPIIALTALAMPGDRERCLAAGANGYLSKPVGLKGLMHAIETFRDRN